MTTPQPIKTKLAQLAVNSDKYSLPELAAELRLLSVKVTQAASVDGIFVPLTHIAD